MTEKIITSYRSLKPANKLAITVVILAILIAGSVVATAATGITFSNQAPANGAAVTTSTPTISVDVAVYEGTVDASDVTMVLDEQSVVPSITAGATAGTYKVSHTPSTALTDGSHSVAVNVTDDSQSVQSTNWTFNADLTPKVTSLSPAEGAIITSASTKITAYIKDSANDLNASSLSLKINGNTVTPNFQFKGHWEYDSCGGSWWVIDSYKEGTMTYTATGLKDGDYAIDLSMADVAGNVLNKSWKYTAKIKPVISHLSPANGSLVNSTTATTISAKVVDETQVDPSTVKLTLNSTPVDTNFDPATGIASYTATLTDGIYNVGISASDAKGNNSTASWSFTFSTDATPQIVSRTPGPGSKVSTASPKISVYVKDTYDNLDPNTISMFIGGVKVTPTFSYKGHWAYDSCGGSWYVIDSYREGTIEYQTSGLSDGDQNIQLRIADVKGNLMDEQWTFVVGTLPQFGNISPVNGGKTKSNLISATVSDSNSINWNTLIMKINGVAVTPSVDASVNSIVYNHTLANGEHTVYMEVADDQGNIGSTTWKFIYDTAAPHTTMFFYYQKGYPSHVWDGYRLISGGSGVQVTNGLLTVEFRLKDLVNIASGKLFVNGNPLNNGFAYPSKTDSCGNTTITTKKEAYVTYNAPVADGRHTLSLEVTDELGNTATYSWPLVVESPPFIQQVTPLDYGITNLTPTISAKLLDKNGTINAGSIDMKLNGNEVQPNFDSATGTLTYQVIEPLADESYQTVSVTVYDNAGLKKSRTWKFYTNKNNYPDMADANYSNCTACHTNIDGTNALEKNAGHRYLSFYGDHGTASSQTGCYECHMYITAEAGCAQCHGDVDYDYAPHGSTPSIKFGMYKFDPNMPQRVKQNREVFDCIICHQPGSRAGSTATVVQRYDEWGNAIASYNEYDQIVYKTQPYWTLANYKYTNLLNNHDFPELHKVPDSSCSKCHSRSLTREHARAGRVDANNQPINCNTCHKSSNTKVQTAIANNDKSCTACHESADHESLHNSTLDSNCQQCHSATLTAEHISNTKTQVNSYDCDTCHSSTANDVKRTINMNSLSCAGCHQTGHNVNFAKMVPNDIPLQSGFQWSTPIEAAIFVGEPGNPVGYDNGLMTLSNRVDSVSMSVYQVWSYYNEALTATGWTPMSQPPDSTTNSFTAEYQKETRYLTVKSYNTTFRDGTGSLLGTKTELWYK